MAPDICPPVRRADSLFSPQQNCGCAPRFSRRGCMSARAICGTANAKPRSRAAKSRILANGGLSAQKLTSIEFSEDVNGTKSSESPVTLRSAALALALLLSPFSVSAQVPAAQQIMPAPYSGGAPIPFPNFIIDAECSRQGGPPHAGPSRTFDFRSCRFQEMEAHGRLLAAWGRIPPTVILSCLAMARGTGFGSYAILATCIEPQFPLR
jgi:hypothetical protein